jgi:hypothetical protein
MPVCLINSTCATTRMFITPPPGQAARVADIYHLGTYTIQYRSASPPDTCFYDLTETGASIETRSSPCTRQLVIKDTLPPAMTLSGPASLVLEGGQAYNDPGANATDVVYGNMFYNNSAPACVMNMTALFAGVYNVISPINTVCLAACVWFPLGSHNLSFSRCAALPLATTSRLLRLTPQTLRTYRSFILQKMAKATLAVPTERCC